MRYGILSLACVGLCLSGLPARGAGGIPVKADRPGPLSIRKSLGALDAPTDLVPRRSEFSMPVSGRSQAGWRPVLDPENNVPEIYEGNNEVGLIGS